MNDQDQKKELTLTREFDAPRELVFKAWTDPELIRQWWGPFGVTNPTCEVDAKIGGKMHIVMLAGEELGELKGQEWPMKGEFKEVQSPEKIVFASSPIMNDKAVMDTLTTVTFEEVAGRTKLTVHIVVTRTTPEAEGPLSGMEQGWNQSLDRLGEFLANR